MLRLDLTKLPATLPLDVKTEEDGTYNPFAPDAPLTVYASGVRNGFDLVWHRNGELYVPVNGSAAGGNTPGTPTDGSPLPATCNTRLDSGTAGPWTGTVPATSGVAAQDDLLLRIRKGKYYGHPNPTRCEYSFFGANPTAGTDLFENTLYPVGTQPDRNYVPASFDLGVHYSPNGAVEYQSSRWNGEMDGSLIVARYSAGDDLVALKVDPTTKEVTAQTENIPGFTGFTDPLDVTEDNRNGNLYVTELGNARITLLRPDETAGAPIAGISPSSIVESAPVGGNGTTPVKITNTGNADLSVNAINVTGDNAAEVTTTDLPLLPATIRPGQSLDFQVKFAPTAAGVRTATVTATTSDTNNPTLTTTVRGLGFTGEPSLQRIVDVWNAPISIGDDDAETPALPQGPRSAPRSRRRRSARPAPTRCP